MRRLNTTLAFARRMVANHERMVDPPPCRYGHLGCSCTKAEGGPCLDEQLGIIEIEEGKRK